VVRKSKRSRVAAARNTLMLGAAALVAIDLGWQRFRRSQLFVPERKPLLTWSPEHYGIPQDRVEVLSFETSDGELLYGWYCRSGNPIASVLYCHGNTGNLSNTAHIIPHLLAAGVNVLTFDYRGFGQSTGSPSSSNIVDDAMTAARLHERIRPAGLPSILYGYSLGGAIASKIIERHPFDGLILQSTFTTLPDITRVTFPHLPLHRISGRFFNTLDVVRRLTIPVLTIHGRADEVCPAWMAESIHESCRSDAKRLVLVDGGLHKDLYTRPDVTVLEHEIHDFAGALRSGPHPERGKGSVVDAALDRGLRFFRRYRRRHLAHQLL
jgi:pimeloyl-ACP methyl ester carboxylesterase